MPLFWNNAKSYGFIWKFHFWENPRVLWKIQKNIYLRLIRPCLMGFTCGRREWFSLVDIWLSSVSGYIVIFFEKVEVLLRDSKWVALELVRKSTKVWETLIFEPNPFESKKTQTWRKMHLLSDTMQMSLFKLFFFITAETHNFLFLPLFVLYNNPFLLFLSFPFLLKVSPDWTLLQIQSPSLRSPNQALSPNPFSLKSTNGRSTHNWLELRSNT